MVKDVTYDTLDIRDINTVLKTNGYTLTLSSNIRMNRTAVFKIIGNGREGKVALKAAEIYQNSTSNKLYLEDVNFEQSNSAFYSMLSGWGYIHIKNSRIARAETDKNAFSASTYTTALLKELLNLREMLF